MLLIAGTLSYALLAVSAGLSAAGFLAATACSARWRRLAAAILFYAPGGALPGAAAVAIARVLQPRT